MVSSGEWKVVQNRRRRFPQHWTHANPSLISSQTKPYVPFASKPTYAQILAVNSPPASNHSSPRSTDSMKTTQPPTPISPQSPTYYVSPHSPTNLRFPPSPSYQEWRGRCFRCCKKGHTKSLCQNRLICGKCWQYGHVGSRCREAPTGAPKHNQQEHAMPVEKNQVTKPGREEPGFDDMLVGSYPLVPPYMPPERPFRTVCFINQEEEDFQEIERLKQAVLLDTHDQDLVLTADTVANYAVRTKLVSKQEVSIAILTRGRYLIHLPKRVSPDRFIKVTPSDLWDFGFSFRPWTPLEGAAIIFYPVIPTTY